MVAVSPQGRVLHSPELAFLGLSGISGGQGVGGGDLADEHSSVPNALERMSEAAPNGGRRGLMRSMFPPALSWWPWFLACVLGVAVGLGTYTFGYAKGLSYFGTDPAACANCHIMEPQYAGWQKASHHTVARCIDCHLPESFIPKYLAKAENGYRHGKLFTTQTFEEPITIKAAGREILQANCERCHADLVHGLLSRSGYGHDPEGQRSARERELAAQGVDCVHCHWTVGHGERAGLGGPARADERADRGAPDTTAEREHD
jgi:cytochrome c nitrite reductase small subunit